MMTSSNNLDIVQPKRQRAKSLMKNVLLEPEPEYLRPRSFTAPSRNSLLKPHHLRHHHHGHPLESNYESGSIYTVRTFEMSSKGVILKKSDSLRSRSTNSVLSSDGDQVLFLSSPRGSYSSQGSEIVERFSEEANCIFVIGASAVGKTALTQQFQTSEYLGGFDTSIGKTLNTQYTLVAFLKTN